MALSLFDLTQNEVLVIEAEFEKAEAEGLDYAAAMERAIGNAEALTAEKVLNYACFIKNLEAESCAIELEIKRLQARKTIKDKKAQALEKRLLDLLPKDFKAEDARAKFQFRKNPASVVVTDPTALPANCFRIIPESREPDKTKIKAMIIADGKIDGAVLVMDNYRVEIK